MAYRDYKVVVWIPYGRKQTVSVLMNHLARFKNDPVDQVWLCMNTDPDQQDDVKYAYQLQKSHAAQKVGDTDFVKVIEIPEGEERLVPKQFNTGKFYRWMTDPDTIYIRMDDDLVYIDDQYFINLIDFRIAHPEYFIVMGQCWNNSIISYLQQNVYHNIGDEEGEVTEPFAMDIVGWQSPSFAEYIHEIFLDHVAKGTLDKLFFDKYELDPPQRFSVSNFCHFGKDFAKFNGDLKGAEEEFWLTETYPNEHGVINGVCGSALVSHYAFFAQRAHLDHNTDILERYRKIAADKLSASYYRMLGQTK